MHIYSSGLIENLAIAIKVARDFNINNKTILKAVKKIKLMGRLQFIKKGKLRKLLFAKEDLLLDGCHSEEGILNHKKNILGMMPHPERLIDPLLSGEDGSPLFESLLKS